MFAEDELISAHHTFSDHINLILRMPVHFEVHPPVPLTPRIESTSTSCALTSTAQILLNCQNILACSTQHSLFIPPVLRPYPRIMRFACVVTANACIELVATEVLDGDDVERRVPMGALRQ